MPTLVKICGINSALARDAAVAAGADFLGFVFFARSPRYVSPEQAGQLAAPLGATPLRVGLFVDPRPEDIAAALAQLPLHALQIYGAVDVPGLKAQFGLPIWRPVGVASAADLPRQANGADKLLVEAKPPPGANRPGGNATSFDWSILRGWTPPCPWMLAGGLTPGNVAQAIHATGAMEVDVSSGVETQPGTKDPALIHAFVTAARAAGGG